MTQNQSLEIPFARGIRLLCGAAILIIGGVFAGGVLWTFNATVGGAVIASGRVTVESSVKSVQHSEGGYIAEILVKNGDVVSAGQTLVRLDRTFAEAEFAVAVDQLNAMIATEARLIAETSGMKDFAIAEEDMLFVVQGEKFDRLKLAQARLIETREASLTGRIRQLTEQVSQTEAQIAGLNAQIAANDIELELVGEELNVQEGLLQGGLGLRSRVNELRRMQAQLEARRGTLISEIARVRFSVSEIEIQMLQLRDDALRDALAELADVQQEKARLIQLKTTAEARLNRLDVQTVEAGVVHDMQVSTIGGVIAPGEVLMSIVPRQDDLVVEAQLDTKDIDQVYEGQDATLMFTSFNMRTTPQISGSVQRLSSDVTIDEVTGQPFYLARLSITPEEIARLGGQDILPGMPVDVFISTEERTVATYMIQPIMDHMNRAFREE